MNIKDSQIYEKLAAYLRTSDEEGIRQMYYNRRIDQETAFNSGLDANRVFGGIIAFLLAFAAIQYGPYVLKEVEKELSKSQGGAAPTTIVDSMPTPTQSAAIWEETATPILPTFITPAEVDAWVRANMPDQKFVVLFYYGPDGQIIQGELSVDPTDEPAFFGLLRNAAPFGGSPFAVIAGQPHNLNPDARNKWEEATRKGKKESSEGPNPFRLGILQMELAGIQGYGPVVGVPLP